MTEKDPKQKETEKADFFDGIKETAVWVLLEPAMKRENVTEAEMTNRIAEYAEQSSIDLAQRAKKLFPEGALAALAMTAVLERLSAAAEHQIQQAVVEKLMQNPEIVSRIKQAVEHITKHAGENGEVARIAELVKGQALN